MLALPLQHGYRTILLGFGMCAVIASIMIAQILPPILPQSSVKFTMAVDSKHAITVAIGRQSLCPPTITCPRSMSQPAGLRVWFVEGPPNWVQLTPAAALSRVSHRQLLYLKLQQH
jgi:hypothetical protein